MSSPTPIHICETTRIQEGSLIPKKKQVVVTIIKAGFGNKAGNRYYSKALLERSAKMFEGKKMYADHLTLQQEKELGGMPRSVRDLVATVKESWYDAASGEVKGRVQICRDWLWEMVTNDHKALEVSIDALGIARNGMAEGRTARVVESFHKVRSVDWVSLGGAGGKVDAILEAQMEVDLMALESITHDDLTKHRPDLIEVIQAAKPNEIAKENGSTVDVSNIAETIKEAVSNAVKEATTTINADADKRVALVESRNTVRQMLTDAKLPKGSADAIYESFHDACTYEAEGDKDGQTRLKEAVTVAIEAKRAEMQEWLPKGTKGVVGMGASASMLEGGEGNEKVAAPLHDKMLETMGLAPVVDKGNEKGGE
jgi:hypothetical protein